MYRIGQEEIDAVARVIHGRKIFKTEGEECFRFEDEVRAKMSVKEAILMTSGQAALVSGLIGMGVGPGDEVIVPGYTYIATAMAVVAVGAIPVICEVDETLTMDPDDMEKKISKYTKAIIPVHMQGIPCNMGRIMEIAKKYNVKVLEDACQANGASFQGKLLGTFGNAGAISYNFYKILTAGEGGCLITDDHEIYSKALIYHDANAVAFFGNQLENVDQQLFCGTEYRANEITAAILREQMKRLDGLVRDLNRAVNYCEDQIKDLVELLPCYDRSGRAGNVVSVRFETAEQAAAFATSDGVLGTVPINTGKHVYTNWKPIIEHNGAYHPAFNPFRFQENQGLNMNYTHDMCPNTLDYLSRSVFVPVLPWGEDEHDWKQKDFDWKVGVIREGIKKALA